MRPSLACRRTVTVTVLVIAALAGQALATNITWDFQRVSAQATGGPPMLSLGMRTGDTWPTVFYDRMGLKAASLTPSGWTETSLGASSDNASRARAYTASDGRVGVTWLNGSNETRFAQSSRYGWQTSSLGTGPVQSPVAGPDLAYTSNNRPVVAYTGLAGTKVGLAVSAYDGLGWNTDLVDKVMIGTSARTTGDLPAIAVDSQDRIALAFRSATEVIFAMKDPSQGTWYGTSLGTGLAASSNTVLSLGFGANDNVALAIKSNNGLLVSHFDIQSGTWLTEQLSSTVASSRVNLAFDSQGNPAVAYSSTDGYIHYSINRGEGWTDILLPKGTDATSGLMVDPITGTDAALAFDRFDNPVIAYASPTGVLLAYDPVVPEPASLLMVVVGLVVLRPRRR